MGSETSRRCHRRWGEASAGLLIAGLLLAGCAARQPGPPPHARSHERAAPNSAVRSGRVSAVRVSGLRITVVLAAGGTLVLPDGHYHHPDGYVLIVSGGRIAGLDGIPPGQIVSARARASNPGRGRGKKKSKAKLKIKIKALRTEGVRIVFVGEEDEMVVLSSGVYSSSNGYRLHIEDGRIAAVVLGS